MRIKRYLSLFLVVLVSVFALGLANKDVKAETEWDYHETFDKSNATASYADGSFIGVEDVVWYYGHSRDEDEFAIDGKGIMLRRASDSYLEATFPNGIGSFYFEFRKAFTGTSDRQLEVIVNGEQVVKGEVFGSTSGEDTTVYNLGLDINEDGPITIRIKNVGNSNSNMQTVIDNFKWTDPETDITATINQLIDEDNQIPTQILGEYGQDIKIPVANEAAGSEFQFALVNGVIRNDFEIGDNTLPITEGLDVSLVYATEETHAVLFLDSNGKLISNTWVDNGDNVTLTNVPATTELSKPGYKLSETPWLSNEGDTSLENITSSRVYRLQYELEETSKVNITVGKTITEYNYNEIVTLTRTNSDFKAWVDEEGNVLSTKETFKFTALVDRTINESDVVPTTLPVVTMSNDLMLRKDKQTFLGQVELRDGDTLVEYGLIVSEDLDLSLEDLTLDNGTKARSNVLVPATNEFMLSIDLDYVVVRAFAIVRDADGVLMTHYSDNQFDSVVVVSFNTDGGNEINPVLVKKGTVIDKPINPTKTGFEFVGWFIDGVEFTFEEKITASIELNANWNLLPDPIMIDIVTSDTNMGSYSSSETVFTHDAIQFGYIQFMKQGTYMQGRNGSGLFYNKTNLGNIQKIVITLGTSQGTSMAMKGGSVLKPGTTINGTVSGMIHTFDFANNQFDFFMLEAKSAIQISKIEIFYFPN